MRLRPPAGSSDLSEARSIAQRLGRPGAPKRPGPGAAEAAGYVRFGGQGGEVPPRPPTPPPATEEPPEARPDEAPPAASASGFELVAERARLHDVTLFGAEPEADQPAPDSSAEAEPSGYPGPIDIPPPPDAVAAAPAGLDSLVDAPPPQEPGDAPLLPDEEAAAEPAGQDVLAGLTAAQPAPLAWESLLPEAQAIAGASAAMIVSPAVVVLASCGEWPAVGAQAVAAKLLPLVAERLEAPGALVPVKLAGRFLSVWRLPAGDDGVLTVAVLAATAIHPDVRSEVDAHLRRGLAS